MYGGDGVGATHAWVSQIAYVCTHMQCLCMCYFYTYMHVCIHICNYCIQLLNHLPLSLPLQLLSFSLQSLGYITPCGGRLSCGGNKIKKPNSQLLYIATQYLTKAPLLPEVTIYTYVLYKVLSKIPSSTCVQLNIINAQLLCIAITTLLCHVLLMELIFQASLQASQVVYGQLTRQLTYSQL